MSQGGYAGPPQSSGGGGGTVLVIVLVVAGVLGLGCLGVCGLGMMGMTWGVRQAGIHLYAFDPEGLSQLASIRTTSLDLSMPSPFKIDETFQPAMFSRIDQRNGLCQ